MNQYITGAFIKKMREEKKLTQSELAQMLHITDKAVSKWETGKGYPDVSLIEPLASALSISVAELMAGNDVVNRNRSCNMRKIKIYVCPVCGNIVTSMGETMISCCGITLPALESEKEDEEHMLNIEIVEDEYYVCIQHDMTREHSISFIAAVADNGVNVVKLYPEGNAETRFKINRTQKLLWYCNRHGLYEKRIDRRNL